MAHVVSIVYTPRGVERKPPDHYARVPLDRTTLVEGHGIDGDRKGGPGPRQLNIMLAETLAELDGEPVRVLGSGANTLVADAGVDAFSLDVMDGRFVPRLSFGEIVELEVGGVTYRWR